MAAYVSCDGYTQAATEQASAIRQQWMVDIGVQLALATWNRNSSNSVTNLQHSIADRQIRMSEEILEHAKKFWPYEEDFVTDAFNNPKVNPQYCATSMAWGGKMDDDMGEARSDYIDVMEEMCQPVGRCMDARWQRNAALRSADVRNYALRQEENRAQALNDQRYSWMYSALALGQGKLQDVLNFQDLAGIYGANAASIMTRGMTMLGAALTGWADSARNPVRIRPDTPQVYMGQPQVTQVVRPQPAVPVQQPARRTTKVYVDGKWIETDVPADAAIGGAWESRG